MSWYIVKKGSLLQLITNLSFTLGRSWVQFFIQKYTAFTFVCVCARTLIVPLKTLSHKSQLYDHIWCMSHVIIIWYVAILLTHYLTASLIGCFFVVSSRQVLKSSCSLLCYMLYTQPFLQLQCVCCRVHAVYSTISSALTCSSQRTCYVCCIICSLLNSFYGFSMSLTSKHRVWFIQLLWPGI